MFQWLGGARGCEDFNSTKIHVVSEYIEAYDFEIFDGLKVHRWFLEHRWVLYCILTVYLLGIYLGKIWMRNRAPYKLTGSLVIWNAGLAVFSIAATIRGSPELIYILRNKPRGIYEASCSQDFTSWPTLFWAFMFVISKVFELGDTAFIILRKQKLIFLHWFHHATVLLVCWLSAECVPAASRFFVVNTFVHSFMYTYYALKAMKFKIRKRVSMALTMLQISQFLMGIAGGLYVGFLMYLGAPCRVNGELYHLSGVIGPVYLFLFSKFFVQSYVLVNKTKTK